MPNRKLTRRAVLRGMGAAIGLPWLESLDARVEKPPVRLMYVYKPGGMIMPAWTPKGEGKNYELSDTLAPLGNVKSDVLVLSGLDSRREETGGNGHPLACAPWLSTAPIGKKDRGGYCTDLSVDQLAARKIGQKTRLGSLEVGCSSQRTNMHTSNISWRGPGSPMGKEVRPRSLFTRLFGDPKGDKYRRSILDSVRSEANGLRKSIGAADRTKVDEYLDSVRSIEKRIQFIEKTDPPPPPKIELPDSIPDSLGEHVRVLTDLVVLGFQADSTRVVTFMYHNEDTIPPIPDVGVTENHHTLVHSGLRPGKPAPDQQTRDKVARQQKVDTWFVGRFAYLLEKLKAVREGDGTLLDNCMIVYGSGLSWGNLHWRKDLPVVLAGKGGGTIKTGRHVRFKEGTPFANLHTALLERVGVNPGKIADSTGPLSL